MATAPGRYWIIQYPSEGGDIIAKFDTAGGTIIPDEVADYGNFNVVEVASRSDLTGKTIDQSGLSDSEKDLLSTVYPIL